MLYAHRCHSIRASIQQHFLVHSIMKSADVALQRSRINLLHAFTEPKFLETKAIYIFFNSLQGLQEYENYQTIQCAPNHIRSTAYIFRISETARTTCIRLYCISASCCIPLIVCLAAFVRRYATVALIHLLPFFTMFRPQAAIFRCYVSCNNEWKSGVAVQRLPYKRYITWRWPHGAETYREKEGIHDSTKQLHIDRQKQLKMYKIT
jgi:hypothetical protein